MLRRNWRKERPNFDRDETGAKKDKDVPRDETGTKKTKNY